MLEVLECILVVFLLVYVFLLILDMFGCRFRFGDHREKFLVIKKRREEQW